MKKQKGVLFYETLCIAKSIAQELIPLEVGI